MRGAADDRLSLTWRDADALVVGFPVYYGVPAGPVITLIQRMAVSGGGNLTGKLVSVVTVCRRGGATSAFQTLQMPFQMLNMSSGFILISSSDNLAEIALNIPFTLVLIKVKKGLITPSDCYQAFNDV